MSNKVCGRTGEGGQAAAQSPAAQRGPVVGTLLTHSHLAHCSPAKTVCPRRKGVQPGAAGEHLQARGLLKDKTWL
jgi:hypothetical protein